MAQPLVAEVPIAVGLDKTSPLKSEGDVIASVASEPDVLVDWDGPNDPGNPKCWSFGSRLFHTVIPSFFGFVATFGTSVYSAGVMQIAEQFHVSRTTAIAGISVYSFGLACGTVIGGPMSEFAGRRGVYRITFPMLLLFTMGAGLSQNVTSLLVCRFFAGTFGSPSLAVSAGTVADVWDMERGGGLAAVMVSATAFMGPTVGPLIGGFVMQTRNDWRWIMWTILLMASPLAIVLAIAKETSKKIILKRRSHQRGCKPPPKLPLGARLKMLTTIVLFRPILMLTTEPIVCSITVYNSFVFGVLFAFFGTYPYVFQSVYGFDSADIGLAFIGIMIGTLLAVLTYIVMDVTLYAKAKKVAPNGRPPPEERLYTAMLGSFGIPISLFWFAWTARPGINFMVPIAAGVPFGWGTVALFLPSMNYLIDTYGALYGASAISANTLLRYSVGAGFPLFIIQMYERLGIPWATSLLGFIGIALLPIPWVLYKWGPWLRGKSRFKV